MRRPEHEVTVGVGTAPAPNDPVILSKEIAARGLYSGGGNFVYSDVQASFDGHNSYNGEGHEIQGWGDQMSGHSARGTHVGLVTE